MKKEQPRLKKLTLEVSLKPFYRTDEAFVESVCREIFEGWKPLTRDAESVAIMLWTSDGSELLDYDGCADTPFEWAYWVGNANASPETHRSKNDPEGIGLHARPWIYRKDPPVMTYGILKRIVSTLRRVGSEMLDGKPITVGTTFDPGPEFARSDFKYRRHREICMSETMGECSFVCSYATLHADTRRYAGYPDGIPEGLAFGSFLGRQAKHFAKDMGFDFIWLSNGLGFGRDTWTATGAVFDGTRFDTEHIDEVKRAVLDFWHLFRRECPDLSIMTRGTNMTMGIDLASDGVPLKAIYDGGFDILPPPNSPWAALDFDFGLELAGYLSRIAELPGSDFLFRYYLHDPWWVNSPWYDRYNGMPHDVYLPLSVSRIDRAGRVCAPTHLNILSIDNTYGEMPQSCLQEVLPHLGRGLRELPDAPAPVVWVYPFDVYSACTDGQQMAEIFAGDWFVRSCINCGLPLSGVVSVEHFIRHDKTIYAASILLTPVPEADSAFESAVLQYVSDGGRVIFYGSTVRASQRFCSLVGVRNTHGAAGELPLTVNGKACGRILHNALIGGGEITEEALDGRAFAFAADRAVATAGEGFVWLRGLAANDYVKGKKRLMPQDGRLWYGVERLILLALARLGLEISFDGPVGQAFPVIMLHRHNNAYLLSQFSPATVFKTKLRCPLGAPVLDGYETVLEEGYATYHFPKSEHRECRVFVEQSEGVVYCHEHHPSSALFRRRIRVGGLQNATVRFLAEDYCKENIDVRLNTSDATCVRTDPVEWRYVTQNGITYCEIQNVTGTLTLSMPMERGQFVPTEEQKAESI